MLKGVYVMWKTKYFFFVEAKICQSSEEHGLTA
jgi:hypothetical protein